MYAWVLEHRDHLMLLFGLSMVLFPLLMGALFGNVPQDFVLRVGFPFVFLTLSMAMGVFLLKRILQPLPMLGISIIFGMTWAGIGAQGILRRDKPWLDTGQPMPNAVLSLSYLFAIFGLIWIVIAIGNYLGWWA